MTLDDLELHKFEFSANLIMSSDEIYSRGLFTAGLQPLQASGIMSVAQTAGAAGNSHF